MNTAPIWTADNLNRIGIDAPPAKEHEIELTGARGQVVSFQVGLRPERVVKRSTASAEGFAANRATIRLCGLVPLRHQTTDTPPEMLDGRGLSFVPDPLVPLDGEPLDANVSRSLWVSVRLPSKGSGELRIRVKLDDEELPPVTGNVTVWPFALPRLELPVTNWFYSDALCDRYGVEPFSRGYWGLVEKYFANLADHNQTAIYTPLFTPPLDNKKRDLQLVDVTVASPGRYRFGFSKLNKWLDLAESAGFRWFEMSHLFSQWGAAYAIRILLNKSGRIVPLCAEKTPATSRVYRQFLAQFLPALIKLLKKRGIFGRSIFHLSDEPGDQHLEQYRAVRQMVREIAPEIRTTEALSHVEFYRHGLIDSPVPSIGRLGEFLAEGLRPWTYYCCGPRGVFPNRFLDYPLYRLAILGPMMVRFGLSGFLHWGCNYWYRGGTTEPIDPFAVNDAHRWPGWAAGDPFIVYPGADGPMDSIRWEVFRQTFDDYRLLKLVAEKVGEARVQELLSEIRAADDYPHSADYLRRLRMAAAALV